MDSKNLILKHWEEQLLDQRQDYETVKLQLRTELDGPTQNRLKTQLESIVKEIEGLEEKIKTREQELKEKADRDTLDRLIEILQRSDAQFDEMRRAYRAVVHARSYRRSDIETVKSLTTELLRIPRGRANYTALEEFAARLLLISDNGDLIGSLESWGDRYCNHWSELRAVLEEQQNEQDQNVKTALLIVVSPSDESTTQSYNGEEMYRLQVWLIKDIEQYKTARQGCQAIGSDINSGLTGDETYSLEAIRDGLKQLFEKENVDEELSTDSEVHLFLPQELLNCDADSWLIKAIKGDMPIGHRYKVFVRLYERLSRRYKQAKKWKGKWEQKKSLLQQKALNVFIGYDDDDDDLNYKLTEENKNMVGLKLIKAPSQDCLPSIFDAIFEMGFPLAIWGRSDLAEAANEIELGRVLEAHCLSNLPQAVRDKRRESRGQPKDGHIGHHLSLLWDDPDLVPPKSA